MAGRLRVIAGAAGGLRLVAPAGEATPPTTDRVRESVFAALAVRLDGFDGLRVLDLYAGSGALGIEALSRGAVHATFVDRAPAALKVVQTNLATTQLGERAEVVRGDAAALAPPHVPYDLVFLDPPYHLTDTVLGAVLERLAGPPFTGPGAVAVVERAAAGGSFALPPRWRSDWERRFGDTLVVFAGLE